MKKFHKYLDEEYKELYSHHDKTKGFYAELDERYWDTDIVVITAHGTEEYIIGDNGSAGGKNLIRIDDCSRLKHSFIFAFSCSTGSLGQQICEQHKAISYIGFNDFIDLVVKTNGNRYEKELAMILKEIYNESLKASFTGFINKNYNVNEFKKLISKKLLESHAAVLAMDPDQIATKFCISKKVTNNSLFISTLQMDLLSTIHKVRERIVVHGEPEFIPWLFITETHSDILKLIEKVKEANFIDGYNEYYKYFMLAYLYRLIDLNELSEKSFQQAKALNPNYMPLRYLEKFTGELESEVS
ncbi:TPA: hypothetical protein VGS93_003746 [Bacillus cereus]|nr:hypothetical protein [Bacillus cereus]